MISRQLKLYLYPVAYRLRRIRLRRALAVCWAAAALLCGALWWLHSLTGWAIPAAAPILGLAALASAAVIGWRVTREEPDWHRLALQIEARHPELQSLLLTAVEQQPDPQTGRMNYLQERVVKEAVTKAIQENWGDAISGWRLTALRLVHWAAFALLVVGLIKLNALGSRREKAAIVGKIEVTPGDTLIERGNGMVVLARFPKPVPAEAALIIDSGGGRTQTKPLAKNMTDPVFGGSIPEVQSNFVYHVAFDKRRTRDYQVTVFEHPRLERADAQIVYPVYTGLGEKRIEDTRRVTAVEGSLLNLALQLNKPVASAKLIGKDKITIPLATAPARASAALTNFTLSRSQTLQLELVDADGRSNKVSAQFIFEALTNQPPELKLAAPRGDIRVSALEEVSFKGEVSDDFGLQSYGLGYTIAGQETKIVTLGQTAPRNEKRSLAHLLALEPFALRPGQLFTYYLWADDFGPDGKLRRTAGDLYFAEVRPFDEIFRQGQSSDGQSSQNSESEQQERGSPSRLAELQKQIIQATWKLRRYEKLQPVPPQYLKDAPVVRQSQQQALEQARESGEKATAPAMLADWVTVQKEMDKALSLLTKATNSTATLAEAVDAEQSAYQALLKLQAKDFQVTQNRSRSSNRSASDRNQRQLDQLELAPSEDRYETQRQASAPQNTQQKEQLQVLNRLKELAQRQQDLNEQLKEMQTALHEAKTEAEREELRRRLKRLQDEERQMLADMDELQQRMESSSNQSQMSQARQELEQTRAEARRAASAMQEQSLSQALTSGTRVQRNLQQMRDSMRQQSASQFADDMRDLRASARELERKQQEIADKMQAMNEPKRKTLSNTEDRGELASQLSRQKQAVTNLLDRTTQVSERAETAEPLLSRKLYDALRQTQQENIDNTLDASATMLRNSFLPQATQLEQRARQGITNFTRAVEGAAESVLGDETEALRQARREIEELTRQAEREMGGMRSNALSSLVARAGQNATNGTGGSNAVASTGTGTRGGTNDTRTAAASSARSVRSDGSDGSDRPGQGQGQTNAASAENLPRGLTPADRSRPGSRLAQAGGARQTSPTTDPAAMEGGDGDPGATGPLTGPDYTRWSERLRDVEEMLKQPELRTDVARVRERAQAMRVEFKRHGKPPQWDLVQTQITDPLTEVRARINEELARRESKEPLVPLDRDPVPSRFSELVRRYYERLGRE